MDLDSDGQLDIVSGSWPGEIFFFKGGPGRTFAAPEMIRDKSGEYINIGGGISEGPDGITITGNGEFKSTPDGTYVEYHGKRIESTPEKPIGVTGTASAVHAADWDGDGDLDLLVGEIGGGIYVIANEGSRTAPAFAKEKPLEADGKPIRVDGDAGPFAVDWDADGDLDLLAGSGGGAVHLFRNKGTAKAPQLGSGETLVPAGEANHGPDAPSEPRRGVRSKVCAADWNGDGRLDLLVGDYATQKPGGPKPTPERQAEIDKVHSEIDGLMERYRELSMKLRGANRVTEQSERDRIQAEFTRVGSKMQELRQSIPPEYETHGWVWLFLRTGATRFASK